jgi:hypothetical protein
MDFRPENFTLAAGWVTIASFFIAAMCAALWGVTAAATSMPKSALKLTTDPVKRKNAQGALDDLRDLGKRFKQAMIVFLLLASVFLGIYFIIHP